MAVVGLPAVLLVDRQDAFQHLRLMTNGVLQVSAGCTVSWEWPLPIWGHVLTDLILLNTISPKVSRYGHLSPWGPLSIRGKPGRWGGGSCTGDFDR